MLTLWNKDFDPMRDALWSPVFRQATEDDERGSGRILGLPYELDETGDHYELTFDVPGVARDDISIEMDGKQLVVKAERKPRGKTTGGWRYGKFQRAFTLPDGITADAVEAECKDGVLSLLIKKPALMKPIKIKVSGDTGKSGGFFKNLRSADKHEPAAMAN